MHHILKLGLLLALSFCLGNTAANASNPDSPAILHWPDPRLSIIDETLYGLTFLPGLTFNCAPRAGTTVAAQWLRLAYHDMSTHDINDGSGGLDASIAFELDRPQNVGQGMTSSLNDFTLLMSPYLSLADLIAMGAALGVASCGGPVIPYRGGRIDATVAGPATVPEPDQDLQTHIASFNRQGFTQTEMIALVACGHSIGGLTGVDFPNVVDTDTEDDVMAFDETVDKFDNLVVTEYLDGTTTDVLVTTQNITTRSDLRIFSSDGNVTMQSIASPENFHETCGILLERMINTVPKGVELTAPVEPFENKIKGFSFYTNNGSYVLKVSLRRLTYNTNRTVTLLWKERHQSESFCPPSGCAVSSTSVVPSGTSFFANIKGVYRYGQHSFTAQIPLNSSISEFRFLVDENDGWGPTLVDNHGSGFLITQDTVLYDPERTQLVIEPDRSTTVFALVVAVRSGASNDTDTPTISVESYETRFSSFTPVISTVILQPDIRNPPTDGYAFFTGNVSGTVSAIHINALVGGQEYTVYRGSDELTI
ncbi:hypothetical protein C0995_012683 [Termitomyces sp. Mi166|nr:hypothetical protein C0995_012683 [Termitomyces sp. Mi166\